MYVSAAQVNDLAQAVDKLNRDKVRLEQEMEVRCCVGLWLYFICWVHLMAGKIA